MRACIGSQDAGHRAVLAQGRSPRFRIWILGQKATFLLLPPAIIICIIITTLFTGRCNHCSLTLLETLAVDDHKGASGGPVEQPFGLGSFHIDTAVAHRPPEVVVPISAMDGISPVKIHRPRNIGQIVTRSGHQSRSVFGINPEPAGHGRIPTDTGGNDCGEHRFLPFMGI